MSYRFIEKIGGGGYGDVHRMHDDVLDRHVAIKFIKTSAGDDEFAKKQAKALSRCKSDNVVAVYALEELEDPKTHTKKLGLVMELVPGEQLLSLVAKGSLSIEEVQRIGLGAINGLNDIHNAGLVHTDLSVDNILVSDKSVKIIDVFYKHTLAGGDSETKNLLQLDDRNDLRILLAKLIRSVNPTQAEVFSKSLMPESTIEDIRDAFIAATDPKLILDVPKLVDHYLMLVNEEGFDQSEAYAEALSEEIHDSLVLPIFEGAISSGGVSKGRAVLIGKLYNRLDLTGRRIVGTRLTEALTREVPNGAFQPLLRLLSGCGKQGWVSLSKVCRMRLEKAFIDNIEVGFLDNYGNKPMQGRIGVYTPLFFSYLSNRKEVLEAVVARLNSGWYGQNYVGQYFMHMLPRLAETSGDRKHLIDGLAVAVIANAFRVKKNLQSLPPEWQKDVNDEVDLRRKSSDE